MVEGRVVDRRVRYSDCQKRVKGSGVCHREAWQKALRRLMASSCFVNKDEQKEETHPA